MKRTNIYLAEAQSAALAEASIARGVSRAELIRELIDSGIRGTSSADLDADLAAIDDAFGVLGDSDEFPARGPDERARHLDRVARQ